MGYNQRKAFTLIELVMVMAIVGVLAMSGGWLMTNFVQNSVFLSNQMNMDMLVADALDIMIEGDSQAKGLRFSRAITTIADYQIVFVNQDSQSISYRLDVPTGQLYRSINGGAENVIPSYLITGITLDGKSSKVFSFYDSNEVVTAVPAQVRWISMTLVGKTGTGNFNAWEGQSEQISAIAVPKFQ